MVDIYFFKNKKGNTEKLGQYVLGFHTFIISNTFTSNARLKLAKKLTNAKHHPEAEFLLFEIY